MDENPTPRGTIARLAQRPQYQPPGVIDEFDPPHVEPSALGLINRGNYIAVDGRWVTVLECSQKNDMIRVATYLWTFEANHLTPCFLAEVRTNANALPAGQ
jgi:hypothetical protein